MHINDMSASFRLTELTYALDGNVIFDRDETDARATRFDIFSGPIAPGGHSLDVIAVYRGHGYGVFKYLDRYTFTVRAHHDFTAEEGKHTRIDGDATEREAMTGRMQDRPTVRFEVTSADR